MPPVESITIPTPQEQVAEILGPVLDGKSLTPQAGECLLKVASQFPTSDLAVIPPGLGQIQAAADQLRAKRVGETVTYVINRNINFTNICEQHCGFCAFRRDAYTPGAYWLDLEEILRKAGEAVTLGATEICLQGGLNPQAQANGSTLNYYATIMRELKSAFPHLHLHAFSPQEIEFIARQDDRGFVDVLAHLQAQGLDSLPGTAAEVLVDRVRQIICPEKLKTETWLEIVTTAHRLGLPTTSTMLCGHIETPAEQIQHLEHLRQLQQTALENHYPGRITEFILLPYVGEQAPLALRKRVGRSQPDLLQTLALTAVARLYLGDWIPNHQPSWVKLGLEGAKMALTWGCNDLGGTLMEEHITTMAGAKGGTGLTPQELQVAITSLGRPAQQRTTLYQPLGDPIHGSLG
ncbi:7,8-didemethyl-8-hydroxy-5-deazariboflavin synthase subunit CofH [Synechococcus sp. PCC 6312]|uniref:7,8-didemethyl-8-hydroxy-5-deazariboflavin synthase subunit CofH n=1 Tax=Synechococcus sp. (strain ATCC 27167 / PCC 6312) TaxID=195253 RepID=UPI00029F0D7B|nr:7,8-didemethyl-8-hydroxy-5-deazariboflavin synthase subunit CofH [Synechococcus sp. PCC 6312]AFY59889.1 FO synthase subunit 2 [Synechococcus sp. PCC 6312]